MSQESQNATHLTEECAVQQPSLLLFDEATSALDSTTERSILQSLQELATGRTALFVAHRLSTAAQCDQIVVLEHGKVMEKGNHIELLRLGGRYATLWSNQATVDDLDAGVVGKIGSTLESEQ